MLKPILLESLLRWPRERLKGMGNFQVGVCILKWGSVLKGMNLLPLGPNSFLLE